jgi:hypothetical protein
MSATKLSDTDKLYAVLYSAGTWVSHDTILERVRSHYGHGITVHSRASELRKRVPVECKVETVNGRKRSYYRLVTS